MLGRSSAKQIDDEPNWREKLTAWRDSPPWVFERPEWMTEAPGTLLLLFGGIAFALISVVYFVLPPTALPVGAPGYFSIAAAQRAFDATSTTSTSSTSTTTTTLSPAKLAAQKKAEQELATDPEKQKLYWAWIQAFGNIQVEQEKIDAILGVPEEAPFRRWTYAMIAFSLSAGLLAAAWFASDTRSRRIWNQ